MASSRERFFGLVRRSSIGESRFHHHYIVLSLLDRWMAFNAYPYVKGDLLDYGCGAQPYRRLFEGKCHRYVGADVAPAHGIALDLLFTPGQPLPLEDESFDTIISTQTLEHVRDVDLYLRECKRLLRPGGCLILSVPMQWRMHEQPFDYWRFTRHGVQSLLSGVELEICDLTPCGGAWALVGQIINSHLSETGRGFRLLYWLVNSAALWADAVMKDQDETIGWMCVAQRPIS